MDVKPTAALGLTLMGTLVTLAGRFTFRRVQEMQARVARLTCEMNEREAQMQYLRHRLERDPLTGLPNRAWYDEHAETFLYQAGPHAALILLDLDHFKHVNDTFGHAAGDALLRDVAHRWREAAGPRQQVVRLSGDEFVVLIPGAQANDPCAVLRQLQVVMRAPFDVNGHALTMTASAGLAFSSPNLSVHDLHVQADSAMYRAKQQRRAQASKPSGRPRAIPPRWAGRS